MGGQTLGYIMDPFDWTGARSGAKKAEEAISSANAGKVASDTALATLKSDQADTARKRVNLFETAGGITGQELGGNQVSKRQTLLGN